VYLVGGLGRSSKTWVGLKGTKIRSSFINFSRGHLLICAKGLIILTQHVRSIKCQTIICGGWSAIVTIFPLRRRNDFLVLITSSLTTLFVVS
jgi:hypothetical protein